MPDSVLLNTFRYAARVPLFDHHCHGLVQQRLGLAEFAGLATEGDWVPPDPMAVFNSPFGIAMRKVCAPIIGLDPDCTTGEYVEHRLGRSFEDIARPLLASTGTAAYGIETGFPRPGLASPDEMAQLAAAPAYPIVRLEAIAEEVAGRTAAASFFDAYTDALDEALAAGAIGVKTIAAYRCGLDLPAAMPPAAELRAAVDRWYADAASNRVSDRTIIGALVWAAIERRLAIQVHVGFGDADVQLDRADPGHLAPLLRASAGTGARFALLHCYPYLRQAGTLAHVFPHVYFDVSLVSHYAGPSAPRLLAEAFEVAPFSRILYASDAYGIPEHYAVSAASWRTGIDRLLRNWQDDGLIGDAQAEDICAGVAHRNAYALYGLADRDD